MPICPACGNTYNDITIGCEICLKRFSARAKPNSMTRSERVREAQFIYDNWHDSYLPKIYKIRRLSELAGRNVEGSVLTGVIAEIKSQVRGERVPNAFPNTDPSPIAKPAYRTAPSARKYELKSDDTNRPAVQEKRPIYTMDSADPKPGHRLGIGSDDDDDSSNSTADGSTGWLEPIKSDKDDDDVPF